MCMCVCVPVHCEVYEISPSFHDDTPHSMCTVGHECPHKITTPTWNYNFHWLADAHDKYACILREKMYRVGQFSVSIPFRFHCVYNFLSIRLKLKKFSSKLIDNIDEQTHWSDSGSSTSFSHVFCWFHLTMIDVVQALHVNERSGNDSMVEIIQLEKERD